MVGVLEYDTWCRGLSRMKLHNSAHVYSSTYINDSTGFPKIYKPSLLTLKQVVYSKNWLLGPGIVAKVKDTVANGYYLAIVCGEPLWNSVQHTNTL